jgi:hypothetical protein
MFFSLAGAVALLSTVAGCGTAPQTVGDAAVLSRQLRAAFHRPATVTVDGRRRLIVTVEADTTDVSDSTTADSSADAQSSGTAAEGPAAQAYQVARFIGAHYQHAGTLKQVTVIVEAAKGDTSGIPNTWQFSSSDIAPVAARPVAPGTKSD